MIIWVQVKMLHCDMTDNAELRSLLKSLRRITRAVDLNSRQIDRQVGLTVPQLVVLRIVRDLGQVTGRAISEEADLSHATIVGILDKLEFKGLIERYRSRTDRRIVHTRLTNRGAAILDVAPTPLGSKFERAFLALKPSERAEIVEALTLIADLASAEADDVALLDIEH
jgi:DNA-binding MarR family transcriptional regulator